MIFSRFRRWVLVAALFAMPGISAAAITFVGSGTASWIASPNTTLTPALPAGHAANDINLVLVGNETGTVTVAGYTQIAFQSSAALKLYLFCKVDGGSESAPSVTLTGGGADNPIITRVYAIRGALANCTDIVAHSASQNNAAADLSVEYPALTVTTPNTFVGIAYIHSQNNTADSTPTGFTNTGYVATSNGNDAAINLKYRIETTAASIAAGAINITGGTDADVSSSIIFSLRAAGSGTLMFAEMWDDTNYNDYPHDLPVRNYPWGASGDKGCTRSVDTGTFYGSAGAFKADQSAITPASSHCMIVYNGPTKDSPTRFVPGVEYWIGFSMYMAGTWPADPTPGNYMILLQMHGSDDHGALNPMFVIDATSGEGQPWKFRVLGDEDSIKSPTSPAYDRNVSYTGCGTVDTNQWVHWVLNFRFGHSDGFWKIYKNGSLCTTDTGFNYFAGDSKGPYATIGLYHGWGDSGPPSPVRTIYFDQWRVGRTSDGVGYSDVAPRP